MAACPKCASVGTTSVRLALIAKPIGTFSIAGAQFKTSARQVAVAECSACGLAVAGHLVNATYADDGATFTDGEFVADQPIIRLDTPS